MVAQSDFAGSTKALVEYVRKAPAGSTIAVGTEVNLVERMAQQYPDKKILPLAKSACPNMWKVSLNDLCWVMENLGQVNVVTVPAEVVQFARVALQNMLVIGKK